MKKVYVFCAEHHFHLFTTLLFKRQKKALPQIKKFASLSEIFLPLLKNYLIQRQKQ